MIFSLVQDFSEALAAMPREHPRYRILKLIDEAIRRDVHFIDRHPTTFFQCMWNTCWWYDCPEAAKYYEEPENGWQESPPWEHERPKLHCLLSGWRTKKELSIPGYWWLRSLRPPSMHLGTAQRAIFLGHMSEVKCVAIAPEGRRIASGSRDMTVRIWDADTGSEMMVLRGHQHWVVAVAFSPDGRRIGSAGDNTVRIWDADTGEQLACLTANEYAARCVTFSPDGQSIVTGSGDKIIRIWDSKSAKLLQTLVGHQHFVTGVAITRDNRRIVSSSDDMTVRVWDSETGKQLHRLEGHAKSVSCVAVSPDGRWIVSGSSDQTVRVWDMETGAPLRCVSDPGSIVTSVAVSDDGRQIISGSYDNLVHIWSSETGELVRELNGHVSFVNDVAVVSGKIASGSSDGSVRLWDAEGGEQIRPLIVDRAHVKDAVFSPDGQWVATAQGKTISIWDSDAMTELARLIGHENVVNCIAIPRDARRIVSGSSDKTMRVWDVESGAQVAVLCGHEGSVASVALSLDGQWIVSGSSDKTIRVWDLGRAQVRCVLRGHLDEVKCVAFSADGRRIASGSTDGVRVWDAATCDEPTMVLHLFADWWRKALTTDTTDSGRRPDSAESVAFSADNQRIYIGSPRSNRVWVCDAETGKQLTWIRGRYDVAALAAVSANSSPLVLRSGVRMWGRGWGIFVEEATNCFVAMAPTGNRPHRISTDPFSRRWVCPIAEYMYLFQLEGCTDK